MYDINKRSKFLTPTVGKLIEKLTMLPQDARVVLCGDDAFYVHIEKDKSVICLDTEDLDEDYIEDDRTAFEDYWKNRRALK